MIKRGVEGWRKTGCLGFTLFWDGGEGELDHRDFTVASEPFAHAEYSRMAAEPWVKRVWLRRYFDDGDGVHAVTIADTEAVA